MAVDIILTLTTVGIDQGNLFNLYSNVDGFNIPYELNVPLGTLQTGYTTSAPDNTTTVRVCGTNVKCINCVDITPNYTTTTTTTLPPVECGELAQSGGVGVTEFSIPLETFGGILVLDFEAFGVVDKLEILHAGIKVATSGMTVANAGPFDNLYGDPTIPTDLQANTVDQFIGTNKGVIPDREAAILADTGFSYISNKQQLIWWSYDANDVITNTNALVRVTGPSGTAWNFTRLCEENLTTTTTTSSSSSTTTTTTTSAPCPGCYENNITISGIDLSDATGNTDTNLNGKVFVGFRDCNDTPDLVSFNSSNTFGICALNTLVPVLTYWKNDLELSATNSSVVATAINCCYTATTTTSTTTVFVPYITSGGISSSSTPTSSCINPIDTTVYVLINISGLVSIGDTVYTDINGSFPFTGNGDYYHLTIDVIAGADDLSVQINGSGVITSVIIC